MDILHKYIHKTVMIVELKNKQLPPFKYYPKYIPRYSVKKIKTLSDCV